jgi:thymidylate synthase
MKVYTSNFFADSYKKILETALYFPDYRPKPRGMVVNEIENVMLQIDMPQWSLYENEKRSSQYKYIAAELVWYFSGRKDAEFISKFSKFWNQIKDESGNVNSAYGNLIFTEKNEHGNNQYQWALKSLVGDKDSRQAVLHFNKPSHQYFGNKDFPCTLTGIFQIRDNRLNFTVNMRSNDLILGMPTDIAFFTVLQMQMLFHLQNYYPNLTLGTYTHIVNSLHLYERHFELVDEMLQHQFNPIKMKSVKESLIDENGNSLIFIKKIENCIQNDSYLTGNAESNIAMHNDSLHNFIINSIYE